VAFKIVSIVCIAIVAIQILFLLTATLAAAIHAAGEEDDEEDKVIYCAADWEPCWSTAPQPPCNDCARNPENRKKEADR
jgi:hypothetical protein